MQSCCPEGSWPQLSVEYEPKGSKVDIQGVNIYNVGQGPRAIIIVTDIFGADSGRHRNVADIFASFGYNVFLPEILSPPMGAPIDFTKIPEFIKNQPLQLLQKRFATVVDYLATKGIKEYFCIGFCWGVWFAFRMATKFQGFRAIVGNHPSLIAQSKFYNGSQQDLAGRVKCPAYLLPAGNDPANIKPKGEVVELLIKRFGEDKVGSTEFPEMVHGWVVRGDVANQAVARDVSKAIHLGHQYFAKFT